MPVVFRSTQITYFSKKLGRSYDQDEWVVFVKGSSLN